MPGPRLLWLVAVVLTPLLGLAYVFSGAVAALLALLLALPAVWDALRLPVPAATVTLRCPERLQLVCGRTRTLAVQVWRRQQAGLRLCPLLPEGVGGDVEWQVVAAGAEAAAVSWALTGRRRGLWRLDGVAVEAVSPWGLWVGRQVLAVAVELPVYPELGPLFRVNAVFLHQHLYGHAVNRLVGQGREFETLRDYQPGDTFAGLDWKATARRGSAIVREYQVEQQQAVYLVLDGSRLSLRPAAGDGETIFEHYVRVAGVFMATVARLHDSPGLAVFADDLHTFCRAAPGLPQQQRLAGILCRVQAQPVVPDLDEVCARLGRELSRRALLVFLLNLDDPVTAADFIRHVRLLRSRHYVTACLLVPAGLQPVFAEEPETAEAVYAGLAGHQGYQRLCRMQAELRAERIDVLLCREKTVMAELTRHYLRLKRRQRL